MRHQLSGRQLSRNAPHRRAMLRNMAVSLLQHETIRTTIPKAKELRRVVEPLITLGKIDTEAKRRLAFSRLRRALEEMVVEGVKTNIPLHQELLRQDDVLNGDYSIKWLEEWLEKREA